MMLRPGTTDSLSYGQVYAERMFAPLADLWPATVLDLGAYIGCASAWFLDRWPHCEVIAVEPDAGNYVALAANLEPYGARARPVFAAVWPTDEPLCMDMAYQGPGQEWSRRVRPCEPGETHTVLGLTVPALTAGWDRIGLLKCDIEGAELRLFADAPWLDRVDAIAAEIGHGVRGAREVFDWAVRVAGFRCEQAGELTICRR